ncbi:MAG: hypothetical protein HYS87_01485 [Candidatus Colwellbacteria bacterium]|nr:hypothetical protein [Candidatus Colwellbacteria bacterium]
MSALIIGAGMFSLPYLFSKSGLVVGFLYLAIFAPLLGVLHVMYYEIVQKTPGHTRFVGYARKYLGIPGFVLSLFTTVVGLTLSLLIYLVLAASFMRIVLPELNESFVVWPLWAAASFTVLKGIKSFGWMGILITVVLSVITVLFFIFGFQVFLSMESIWEANFANWLLPYGAVLFALSGRSAVTAVKEYFGEKGDKFAKPSIFAGTLFPVLLYAVFVIGVLGLSTTVSENALAGMDLAPSILIWALVVVGVLFSFWDSYVFLGLELNSILKEDFKLKNLSKVLVVLLPITLYFMGLQSFIVLVSVSGGIFLALESILVISMWLKLAPRSILVKLAASVLIAIFVIGGVLVLQELVLASS